jgi:hypothetical protein
LPECPSWVIRILDGLLALARDSQVPAEVRSAAVSALKALLGGE